MLNYNKCHIISLQYIHALSATLLIQKTLIKSLGHGRSGGAGEKEVAEERKIIIAEHG